MPRNCKFARIKIFPDFIAFRIEQLIYEKTAIEQKCTDAKEQDLKSQRQLEVLQRVKGINSPLLI